MNLIGWIISVPILILIVVSAIGPVDEPPLTPRKKVLIRHAWEKMLREEEREGVRRARGRTPPNRHDERPEPQAKWSDRR
jgi:hypothetical protein